MDKSKLKKFAINARAELQDIVKAKIEYLTSDEYKKNLALYDKNKDKIEKIKKEYEKKKEEFIEEVAYTWFNRLIALRFMELNDITSKKILSGEGDIPQILTDAKAGDIDENIKKYLDIEKFYALIGGQINTKNAENEAYKMLFIAVCNYYNELMPYMFEKIDDFTELLLPEDLLSPNSIRAKVVEAIDKVRDVEVIGWLYQFYISEKKDEAMSKKSRYKTSEIPAVTQLFTPHWIVRYLVENSLGRLWLLNNPNSALKGDMRYFIEQESGEFLKVKSPEEIKVLDPCCGSGHMLTYAFDLLAKMYEERGYLKKDIAKLILEKNLYGCDIDKRAATLATFALHMKARLYYRRFFKTKVLPNIVELQEYDGEYRDIKDLGSLLRASKKEEFDVGLFAKGSREYELQRFILSNEFDCVITNPPYMGNKGMNEKIKNFVKKHYPDSKSDLFAVFIERGLQMTKKDGYLAMITMQSWMFLSSFEKLRVKILKDYTIKTLAHLGNMVMGIAFGTSAFVLQKIKPNQSTSAVYFRIDLKDLDENREIKGLK